MTKKHLHLIVEKELATRIIDVQNLAFNTYDTHLSKNALIKIAITELLTQIKEDESKLKEVLLKYGLNKE